MHFCTLHIKEQMKKHEIIFILTILLLSKSWVRKKLFQRKCVGVGLDLVGGLWHDLQQNSIICNNKA